MARMPVARVPIGCEGGKASRQIRADHARQDEDEAEEAKAVQRGDGALRLDVIELLQPRPDIDGEAKQPGGISQYEMRLEQDFRGHACGAVERAFEDIGHGNTPWL
jgi:hypothetical protein